MESIDQEITDNYAVYMGDCCEVMPGILENSIDMSIFSPPFSNLFVYSDSERDMGNCANDDEFFHHFSFMVRELYRITVPGRLAAVHCIDLPLHKFKDGVTGLKDFPGEIIRCFQNCGWTYHSRVTIWKDPVIEMQRTKALGLLHKTITRDSSQCRQGSADYLLVFRKSCDVSVIKPVAHPKGFDPKEYVGEMGDECQTSIDVWQRYASPVWSDIRQTHVLNKSVARDDRDERHICPLQLDVIKRAIHLWSNPGEVIFSPLAGIGSEIVSAVSMGRKAIGIELKPSYYVQMLKNLSVENEKNRQMSLLAS